MKVLYMTLQEEVSKKHLGINIWVCILKLSSYIIVLTRLDNEISALFERMNKESLNQEMESTRT